MYMHTWVLGFVSGGGYTSDRELRITDSGAMAAWIDQYCAAHPLDNVATAAGKLVLELERKR